MRKYKQRPINRILGATLSDRIINKWTGWMLRVRARYDEMEDNAIRWVHDHVAY